MTTSDRDIEASFDQLGRFFMGTSDVHLAMERLVRKLDELQIPYAICGGMALNAHGYQRATTDVDVLLTPTGLQAFKEGALGRGWLEQFADSRGIKDTEGKVPIDVLLTGGIPGDGTAHGVVFPDPADAAIEIGGRRYLALQHLVELKLVSGISSPARLKDLADVLELIRVNALGEHFGDALHAYVRAKYRELWRAAQLSQDPPG